MVKGYGMNAFRQMLDPQMGKSDVQEYVLDFMEQLSALSESAGLRELALDLETARKAQLIRD